MVAGESAFCGPHLPAALRQCCQSAQCRQNVCQRDQRHRDLQSLRDDLRVLDLAGHIGDAFISAVHPDADADSAAQSVDQCVVFRHERFHRIGVPVEESDDGDQQECCYDQKRQDRTDGSYFSQAQQIDDGEYGDHADFQRQGSCIGHGDHLAHIAGYQRDIYAVCNIRGYSCPPACLESPELTEGLLDPNVHATL